MDVFQKRLWLMRHRLTAWVHAITKYRADHVTRMVMILLTYRRVKDYRAGHIRDYLKDLKRRLGSNLLSFAWVAELQGRGAVHYHLILLVNKGSRIPKPDESKMWKHGLSGIHTARQPFYLLKYTGKERQKDLSRYPRSCRLYAVSVRGLSGAIKEQFRIEAGIVSGAGHETDDETGELWEYVGSSVEKEYMAGVLNNRTL